MSRRAARTGRSRLRGLTLVEMLVTLVLVAALVAMLAQAMVLLARVERLLAGAQLQALTASLRAVWVREALEGLLPGSAEGERLVGEDRQLRGLTSVRPAWPAPVVDVMQLRIVDDDGGGSRLELEALAAGPATSPPPPSVLMRWPDRTVRFRYLDAQGNWLDRWPGEAALSAGPVVATVPSARVPMPRAIALAGSRAAESPILIAVPRATPIPLPTRRRLETM